MPQPFTEEEKALAAGYVLGDLSAEELAQLEALLPERPDLWGEIDAMQISLQLVPHALPKETAPPPLKEKILNAYPSASREPSFPQHRSLNWGWLLAGAAVLAALILGTDNLRLRRSLADSFTEDVEEILQRPNSRLVALQGEGETPPAGTLLFTPGQWQEIVISLGNLPPLPPEEIYRMWLSLENGDTIFCGEFNTGENGSVFIKLEPLKTPPKGVKATGIYVTVDAPEADLDPTGDRVMSGEI